MADRSGYIGRAPGDSSITIARKTYEPTGVQTDFTFTAGYNPGYCDVYVNGVRLISGNDYTASNGSTVGLTSAAQSGDIIEVVAYKAFNLGVPLSDITGNLDVTGNISASSSITAGSGTGEIHGAFVGDGSGLTGVASTDYIITGTAATFNSQVKVLNLNVTGVSTVSTALHVGTALTANAAGDVETIGIITAASFSGDGANLTNVGMDTSNIVSVAITTKDINVSAAATITGALTGSTGTFSGAINVDATTDSTSSTSGALIVDGGVGIAKNVYIGAGLSVAGTLTYEDVTNVDSVGMITAKSGVNVSGGELNVGLGFSVGNAGVATFSGTADVHLKDDVQLKVGDGGSDFYLYHDGTNTHLKNDTGKLLLNTSANQFGVLHGSDDAIISKVDGAVELYFDNSKKWETTNDGAVTTGIATATVGIDAAISVWTLGADGTSHYTFTGPGNLSATNDPTLNLIRGQKYTFKNRSGGHPFRIQSTINGSAGTAYNTGVTNNDGGNGTNILFDVPYDAPAVLYYQCTSHGNMGGAMYISGSGYETKIGTGITIAATSGVTTFADGSDTTNALKFGSGGDLTIYHDGSHSHIVSDTGNLRILADGAGDLVLTAKTGEESIVCSQDGAVDLHYDNSTKLITTTSGVQVTGTVAATNYTGDGSALTGVGGDTDITSCLFV